MFASILCVQREQHGFGADLRYAALTDALLQRKCGREFRATLRSVQTVAYALVCAFVKLAVEVICRQRHRVQRADHTRNQQRHTVLIDE